MFSRNIKAACLLKNYDWLITCEHVSLNSIQNLIREALCFLLNENVKFDFGVSVITSVKSKNVFQKLIPNRDHKNVHTLCKCNKEHGIICSLDGMELKCPTAYQCKK